MWSNTLPLDHGSAPIGIIIIGGIIPADAADIAVLIHVKWKQW